MRKVATFLLMFITFMLFGNNALSKEKKMAEGLLSGSITFPLKENNSYLDFLKKIEPETAWYIDNVKPKNFFSFTICAPVSSKTAIYFQFGQSVRKEFADSSVDTIKLFRSYLDYVYLGACRFFKNHFIFLTTGIGATTAEYGVFERTQTGWESTKYVFAGPKARFLMKVGYGFWISFFKWYNSYGWKSVGIMPIIEYGSVGTNMKIVFGLKF